MTNSLWTLLGAVLLVGCPSSDDSGFDSANTDDTGEECATPSLSIVRVAYDYDDAAGWWHYYVLVDTIAAELRLDVNATQGKWIWDETHVLENTAWDERCEAWAEWERFLPVVDDPTDQITGESTLFGTDSMTEASMTWAVRAFDEAKKQGDCWTWGADPSMYADQGCTEVVLQRD